MKHSIFYCLIFICILLTGSSSIVLKNKTGFSADNEPENMKGMLERHNYWRAKWKLPALKWSTEMQKLAQGWADELAKKGCKMEHRPNNKAGENIYWSSGIKSTTQMVTDAWANEKDFYDFAKMECKQEWWKCGHFTQLVWSSTTQVGCGMAKCGEQEIWVCNYNPPGNWVGQKPFENKK